MTHTTKTERRRDLETPHWRDHERSVERGLSRGVQPKGLPALLAWFREVSEGELPTAIHKAGVWRDHGPDAEGGSKLGTPASSDAFRRLTEGTSSQLDGDGCYLFPLRAALERMARTGRPLTARALYRLALHQGDWRALADQLSYPDEFMELYIERALFHCWREYATERRLT
ncbi:MAG: hypothetical protein KF809_17405 [Chloroflexi bacterium]|nr:hypothetical protein [Chloroflexota bacterium]